MHNRRAFLARSAHLLGGATLLSAVPLLAACGDDDDDDAAGTTPGTAAGTTPAAATTPAAGTTGGTAAAGSLGTVRTQFSWVPDIEWAAWYLAESKGFFAARGVESVLGHGGPNTPAVVQLMAAGDGDIGLSGDELEILKANATGADYVAIAAMYQRSPFGYAWLKETNITGRRGSRRQAHRRRPGRPDPHRGDLHAQRSAGRLRVRADELRSAAARRR